VNYHIEIDEAALQELRELRQRDDVMFKKCSTLIDLLEKQGPHLTHVKKLVGTHHGWRLDFGRYRALFSCQGSTITIWQIGMEKDTKKDYKRWIQNLIRSGKID
jgi:mRNA-degrading endonuclease RelE of RelBE toxin-antitoxin system